MTDESQPGAVAADGGSAGRWQPVHARLRLASRKEYLEAVHNLSERLFEMAGVDSDQAYWLVVAVREAVINALLHGNMERADSEIVVEITVSGGQVEICVQDQGEGFTPDELPDPVATENLMSQDGRGVYLMQKLMDEVTYDFPDEGGTRLCMVKDLDGDGMDLDLPLDAPAEG